MKRRLYQKINTFRGYTLVELLAVMVILIVVGSIILSIYFSSIRGTKRTEVITSIRQNGSIAMSEITKNIRFAQKLEATRVNSSDATCQVFPAPPAATPTPQLFEGVRIQTLDLKSVTYTCDRDINGELTQISSRSATTTYPLLDTSSVALTSCYFTCTQGGSASSPTIGVSFTLSQEKANPLLEETASIPFHTSVIIRNQLN